MASILLIEDNEELRSIWLQLLESFGHEVFEARNGKEGLKLYGECRADVVITDIVMPEIDGLGVLIELRRINREAKIIAISGGGLWGGAHYLDAATLLGATKVLTKPFSAALLMSTINDLLSSAAPKLGSPIVVPASDKRTPYGSVNAGR